MFALGTGCRIGEILALKWYDVDFEQNIVIIRHSVGEAKDRDTDAKHKRKRVITDTKTDASEDRIIPLTEEIKYILLEHKKRQINEKEKAGETWHNNHLVFCTALGGYLLYSNIRRLYTKLRDAAGVSSLAFHCLRHTFATNAIYFEIDYYYLSKIMGHKQISITLDTYADFMPDKAADEMSKIDGILLA